jgi:hypothetical protein
MSRHHEPVDFRSIDSYVEAIWLLSLAILFTVDDALFDRVLAINGNRGLAALYDHLVAARRDDGGFEDNIFYARDLVSAF